MAFILKDQWGLLGVAIAFSGGFILGALSRMVIVCTHATASCCCIWLSQINNIQYWSPRVLF